MYKAIRSLLFQLDAETSHNIGLATMGLGRNLPLRPLLASKPVDCPTRCFGIEFPNPVGLAAGLDKNGDYLDALFNLGFGFVEIGTVTPRPQPGNPKPRMFRLQEAKAIINRLGFNNKGVDHLVNKVERSRALRHGKIIGINIGKNKDTPNNNAADDYVHCLERVYPLASYVTINISSPNTQGLRDLQAAGALSTLLDSICNRREQLATQHKKHVPLLVKLAPDLTTEEQHATAAVINAFPVNGVICGNTTVSRTGVSTLKHGLEKGGLSGAPLREKADSTLRAMRKLLSDQLPLIGVGGIMQPQDAVDKLHAGACLVQFYTGLIYQGPQLISGCVNAIQNEFK